MADNKNQHFIPQYYFRLFNEGGDNISLLLRRDGRVIRSAPIRGQSSKSYFYGDMEVEKQVTAIESQFISPLRRIKAMEDLTGLSREDHELLVQAIMFQRARTAAARIDTQPIFDSFLRTHAELAINADEGIEEKVREELRALLPEVKARPEGFQGLVMALAVQEAYALLDLGFILVKNKTSRPFVFGDAPVVFTNPAQKKVTSRGVLGARTPGLVVYYPIGPFEAIMLVDQVMYSVKGVRNGRLNVKSLQDVAELNRLQIHASRSSVYFNDCQYTDYVKHLWGGVGAGVADPRGVVKEIKIDDERELVHNYERQLPFFAKLTFLSFIELAADSYYIDREMYYA